MANLDKKQDDLLVLSTLLQMDTPDLTELNSDQLKTIAKAVTIDDLKKQYETAREKARFDLDKTIAEFMQEVGRDKNKQSEATCRGYRSHLDRFINWLDERRLHPLDVNRDIAREYNNYINSLKTNKGGKTFDISPKTKRVYLAPVRAFYSFIQNEKEVIGRNPFQKLKVASDTTAKPLYLLTEEELQALFKHIEKMKHCEGRGADKAKLAAEAMLVIVDLLLKTGLRAGAVCSIKIKGSFLEYDSKGKKGRFDLLDVMTEEESQNFLVKLRAANLSEWNPSRIQKYLQRVGTIVFPESPAIFHPHNFRHFFAVQDYRQHKDIYRLKMLLNHGSVVTTENYLKSLSVK